MNDSGRRFLSYLSINNLTAVTTFFKKKQYATWVHPRSKKTHQIDHFIVNKEMFHRCIDAGVTSPILDSDHCAIYLKLRVMKRLKKKTNPRQRMLNFDHSKLSEPYFREKLCEEVKTATNSASHLSYTDLSNAVMKATSSVLQKKAQSSARVVSS